MNKVQHVKWCMKQTKLTSEISCPTDLLPSSVGRALVSWSGGPGFNSHCTEGNFWWIFFALPCVKIRQVIWQKRLSWKTQLKSLLITIFFKFKQYQNFNSVFGKTGLCKHDNSNSCVGCRVFLYFGTFSQNLMKRKVQPTVGWACNCSCCCEVLRLYQRWRCTVYLRCG